jgi:RimJ/RimL family protein N-acetyltransferase
LGRDRLVTIRPIAPADATALMDFYASLSPETRRRRFFHVHRVTSDEAQGMAAIDEQGGVALVAVGDDNRIVADARCIRANDTTDGTVADLGVAVGDDYQGLGLGHLLVDRVIAAAAQVGITTILCELFAFNTAMQRLLSKHHFTIINRNDSSLVEAMFTTDGRVPAWPADATRPRILVEAGSWYGSMQERHLRTAGFSVAVCPGSPRHGTCDLLATGCCRLAEGADAIICSAAEEGSRQVLAAHEATATIPIFVNVGPEQSPSTKRAQTISRTATPQEVLRALEAAGIHAPD